MFYSADFETTLYKGVSRVWLWAIVGSDGSREHGFSIHSFFDCVSHIEGRIYFHNLAFDGSYIIDALLKMGYVHTQSDRIHKKHFNTLIGGTGVFYSIRVNFDGKIINFNDSFKVIPFAAAKIPKLYGLTNIAKGEIDYTKERPLNYKPTVDEIDYVYTDTDIVIEALKITHKKGINKTTIASSALNNFKHSIDSFDVLFPAHYDSDMLIRRSYKGGVCQLRKGLDNKILNVDVYDVNSMYPWTMRTQQIPYGVPQKFLGEYQQNNKYPLFVQRLNAHFVIKPRGVPMIQLKNNSRFSQTEYVLDSEDDITLTLTSVDLELFLDNYDIVGDLEYIDGYMFKSGYGIFDRYIDYWYDIKKNGVNKADITVAKLMLNSLYGKFGTNPKGDVSVPYLDNRSVSYKHVPTEKKPIYVAVASFITSYARNKLVRGIMENYDNFIYCDTDSIHVKSGTMKGLKISDMLGDWDFEKENVIAKYLHQKTYIMNDNGNIIVKCAGMPRSCRENVTFDNFHVGAEFKGQLKSKTTEGGKWLFEQTFKIRG